MIIFGIDPGVAITGWGVVSDDVDKGNGLCAVDHGIVETEKHVPHLDRLAELQADIAKLLDEFSPDVVAVEQLFFSKNTKTALSVGEARGATLVAIANAKIPIKEFTPPQVKDAVCGYGKAPKRQVQEMVQSILGMESMPTPDDAADALAVAICCASTMALDEKIRSS